MNTKLTEQKALELLEDNLKKYSELKESDKEKFNKIFMEIQKLETKERWTKIKKAIEEFFYDLCSAILYICLGVGFVAILWNTSPSNDPDF